MKLESDSRRHTQGLDLIKSNIHRTVNKSFGVYCTWKKFSTALFSVWHSITVVTLLYHFTRESLALAQIYLVYA